MSKRQGIYRLVDRENNNFILQGTKAELSKTLNISIYVVENLIRRGSLKYKIYKVDEFYKYNNKIGTISELANMNSCQYYTVYYNKELGGHRLKLCGYDADTRVYAMYKGDDILATGTASEIIDAGWTTPHSFYDFYYKPMGGKNAKTVVLIED